MYLYSKDKYLDLIKIRENDILAQNVVNALPDVKYSLHNTQAATQKKTNFRKKMNVVFKKKKSGFDFVANEVGL